TQLLDLTLPENGRQAFMRMYAENAGSPEEFWNTVRSSGDIPASDMGKVQDTLQLSVLTGNHLPLVEKLAQDGASPADAARLDVDDWKNLIRSSVGGQTVGVPEGTLGATDEEKIQNYA